MDVSASGWVNGTEVRMRAAAGTDSAIVRVTSFGESVEITGVAGEWYRVNAGGQSGYIRSDYVELGVRETAAVPQRGRHRRAGRRPREAVPGRALRLGRREPQRLRLLRLRELRI